MQTPLINPSSASRLKLFANNPPQAVGIFGYGSAYRRQVIDHFCRMLMQQYKIKESTIFHIVPEKNSIGIDEVRAIRAHTRSQSQTELSRVIVIHDAQTLTKEAQNALLKLIEEPPSDTIYILSATDTAAILPTILSRLQSTTLRRLTSKQVGELSKEKQSLLAFLQNNPELVAESNEEQSLLLAKVKQLLGVQFPERVAMCKAEYADRSTALNLIEQTISVMRGLLAGSSQRLDTRRIEKLCHSIETATVCHERIQKNGSTKANLDVFLSAL